MQEWRGVELIGAVVWVVVCLLGTSAYADTSWTGATDTEFGTASNWDNGSPGNPETVAIISTGGTVNNTTNHTGTNAYQLTVSGGSTLNSSADFTTTYFRISGGSTVNLTGGSVTVPVQTPNNNGTKIEINDGSLLNISGGVHTFNERIATYGTTKSTIRIVGSEATVNVHQQSTFTATIEFVFDADGISTLDSDSRLGLGGSDLTVDARAYTGPSRIFTLVDVDWLDASSGFGGTIDITPPTGYTYSYNQDDIQTTGAITLALVEPGKALIFYDDFRENELSADGVHRDGGWAGGADWAWSSGQMVNAGATRGMGRVVPVPSGLTAEKKLEFRLEYSASTNSSLAAHLWGLKDVSSGSNTWVMNLGGTVGMWYSAGGAFERCHLGNGTTNFSGAAGAAAVQIPSNVGTGLTYSCELNISGFEAGLSQVSDYDYIAIGFQKGNGAATVSLDEVGLCAIKPNGMMLWIR